MAQQKYDDLAKDIIIHVGGKENIEALRHCVTRLRFNLKDSSKADTDYLKKREGIVTVVEASGQYQVVIGNEVGAVYDAIVNLESIGESESSGESQVEDNHSILNKFIDLLSGLFQPLLGALSAAGLIKGIGAMLIAMGVDPSTGFMQVWNILGDGLFQLLPVALIITSARTFKMNVFTAIAVGSVLLYPSLGMLGGIAGESQAVYTLFEGTPFAAEVFNTFLGIPIILPPSGSYYGSVIPIILTMLVASKIENWIKRWMPQMFTSFLTPLLTIVIAGTFSLLVIGPMATWIANLIVAFISWLYTFNRIVFHVVLQAAWQILVIFGLHWGIIPLMVLQYTGQGYSVIESAVLGSTFPIFGAILAILWKSNEQKTKQIAASAALPAFFGVTEQAVYGLMLPMRKVFGGVIAANALIGVFNGYVNLTQMNMGGLGVFAIPNYIDPHNPMNVWNRIISFVMLTVLGFVFTLIIGIPNIQGEASETMPKEKDFKDETNTKLATTEEIVTSLSEDIIASPLNGKIISLSEVSDPVFSSGAMGKGVAIIPDHGVVYSPANAEIVSLFPTGHAIGLKTENGTEILIHIGVDTVALEGEGYETLVKAGDKVTAGQELIHFDMQYISESGYSLETPIIVTNSNDYEDILLTDKSSVSQGDYLFTTVSKR